MILPAAAHDLLQSQRVAHFATSVEGKPHCMPVCFYFDGTDVYIALDEKPKSVDVRQLRRVRNLLENPHVALVVDRYDEDWTQLEWVHIEGRASLTEPDSALVAALRSRYPQYRTMAINTLPLIRIEPSHARYWAAKGLSDA